MQERQLRAEVKKRGGQPTYQMDPPSLQAARTPNCLIQPRSESRGHHGTSISPIDRSIHIRVTAPAGQEGRGRKRTYRRRTRHRCESVRRTPCTLMAPCHPRSPIPP